MNEEVIKAESRKGSIEEEVRQFVANGCRLEDVVEYGCHEGIPDLTYYRETLPFFSRHREEIEKMLGELIEETGCTPGELFKNWDKSDPLANGTINQNLLTWFAFEQVAQKLYYGGI